MENDTVDFDVVTEKAKTHLEKAWSHVRRNRHDYIMLGIGFTTGVFVTKRKFVKQMRSDVIEINRWLESEFAKVEGNFQLANGEGYMTPVIKTN